MSRKTGDIRKSEIIATAREIIFFEGFSNFTIRSVAMRVGISEAAIYRHFANKEELMLGMLESLFGPWRDAIASLVAENGVATEKLQKLVELHLHHLIIMQLNPVLFFSEAIRPENTRLLEVLNSNMQFLLKNIRQILNQAVEQHLVCKSLDVDAAAACVIGILQTSVIKWTLQRSDEGLREGSAAIMQFFSSLLTSERKSK